MVENWFEMVDIANHQNLFLVLRVCENAVCAATSGVLIAARSLRSKRRKPTLLVQVRCLVFAVARKTLSVYGRRMFRDSWDAYMAGSKGGESRSKAKQDAARANLQKARAKGKKGGRPSKWSVAERLLDQKIDESQHKSVKQAYDQLFHREKERLQEFFGVNNVLDMLDATVMRKKSSRVPRDVRYAIDKFRLAAKYFIKPPRPPKDYIVESIPRSDSEQKDWEERHPDMPCPPIRKRVYFGKIPDFDSVVSMYGQNPELTARTVTDACGSRWTLPRAEAVLKWLNEKCGHLSDAERKTWCKQFVEEMRARSEQLEAQVKAILRQADADAERMESSASKPLANLMMSPN